MVATDTMDTTAKDLPSPLPLLRLMPMPPLDTDTAMADMVTMDMAAMDTTDTTERGKLKLLLLLSPLPMPLLDTDTTAMVTDMVMAMDTATAMDTGTDTAT